MRILCCCCCCCYLMFAPRSKLAQKSVPQPWYQLGAILHQLNTNRLIDFETVTAPNEKLQMIRPLWLTFRSALKISCRQPSCWSINTALCEWTKLTERFPTDWRETYNTSAVKQQRMTTLWQTIPPNISHKPRWREIWNKSMRRDTTNNTNDNNMH